MPSNAPGGYSRVAAITKSDTVNFDGTVVSATGLYGTSGNTKPIPADAIYVGGAGIVVVVMEDGSTSAVTAVAGGIIPVRAIRVNSTTTSATVMSALYQ